MKTTNTKWRNCPFCGGEITQKNVTTEKSFDSMWASNDEKGCVTVRCPKCDLIVYQHDDYGNASKPAATYEELIEGLRTKWNTRRTKRVRKETEG